MIHLITGRPGHGKNIYALTFLEQEGFITYDKESETFSSHIDRPLFFIDFAEINIIDATTVSRDDLDDLPIDQDLPNNSKFPDNAIIVCDEAHKIAPKSANKDGFTNFVSFLKIHRHYGFDFVFITQAQKDLNIDIRNLVEYHYRVNRPFGTKHSFVNKYNGAETTENKNPIKISSQKFILDPRFFKIYKSASIHNYKSTIPKKYYFLLILFLAFIAFVGTKMFASYTIFTADSISFDTPNPDSATTAVNNNNTKTQDTLNTNTQPKSETIEHITQSTTPYFYKFKNRAKFKKNKEVLKGISPNIFINDYTIFCHCYDLEVQILDTVVKFLDKSNNIKIEFILVTFDKKDYLDFNLKYSFKNDHFQINGGTLISNFFLFDYLEQDYSSVSKIKSSAFIEIGELFTADFITKYPKLLRSYDTSISRNTENNNANLVNETIDYNDIGFKFSLLTDEIDEKSIRVKLKQSHSFLNGFKDDLPIIDTRDFKTSFIITDDQLVPLFNLSNALNSKNQKSTIPFLGWLFPDNKTTENSNYQVFLKVQFVDEHIEEVISNFQSANKIVKNNTQPLTKEDFSYTCYDDSGSYNEEYCYNPEDY